MEMEKKRIVYSLTGRGLFSELSNLALALVYADYNQEELTVNTRNWNARVEKGWSDYFESVLPDCNGVMCSQYIVYKKGKPCWGNIYYNPSAFFRYYIFYIMNRIYLLFHPETELGNEVFLKMRSEEFLEKLEDITYKTAFLIGLFQVLSIVPGTSRSGSTIIGALLIGVSRVAAAEFTFFLAVPVMFGYSLLKVIKMSVAITSSELVILIVGCAVAFAVSLVVIKFLMSYIKKHDFQVFGVYRIILGIAVIAYFALAA